MKTTATDSVRIKHIDTSAQLDTAFTQHSTGMTTSATPNGTQLSQHGQPKQSGPIQGCNKKHSNTTVTQATSIYTPTTKRPCHTNICSKVDASSSPTSTTITADTTQFSPGIDVGTTANSHGNIANTCIAVNDDTTPNISRVGASTISTSCATTITSGDTIPRHQQTLQTIIQTHHYTRHCNQIQNQSLVG